MEHYKTGVVFKTKCWAGNSNPTWWRIQRSYSHCPNSTTVEKKMTDLFVDMDIGDFLLLLQTQETNHLIHVGNENLKSVTHQHCNSPVFLLCPLLLAWMQLARFWLAEVFPHLIKRKKKFSWLCGISRSDWSRRPFSIYPVLFFYSFLLLLKYISHKSPCNCAGVEKVDSSAEWGGM